MTIDFWGVGLQALNVLILIWLLSRVFWRPVAAAIAKRQETAKDIMKSAKATQAKADTTLAEATEARAGIEAERTTLLDAARKEAEAASKTALAEARTKADAIIAAAKTTISHDAEEAQKTNAEQASDLSLKIAAQLLERLNTPLIQSAFLSQLVEAIADLSDDDRKVLVTSPKGVEIVSAADTSLERETIKNAVQTALGGTSDIRFTIDPDLIAGLELRSPHFVLYNSWQADLAQIQKAVKDAA